MQISSFLKKGAWNNANCIPRTDVNQDGPSLIIETAPPPRAPE